MQQQDGAGGVATAAKDQAAQVGQTATQAGGQVARTTKDQAANVVGEATQQARDLVGEARTQLGDQAGAQKGRAVEGLRTLGDELRQMADQGQGSGLATEIARQAAGRAHGLADHLDRHEPTELIDQVRAYARRRPVVFLTGAAVLGVLAGRLTRNLASDDSSPRALGNGSPALPAAGTSAYDAGPAPVYGESVYEPPLTAQPGFEQPGFEQPGYAQPAYEQPGTRPGFADPAYEQPAYEQPGAQPGFAEPAYDQPGAQPGYEQPGGGFRPVEEADPAYQPASDYPTGTRPQNGPEGENDDPTWRNP